MKKLNSVLIIMAIFAMSTLLSAQSEKDSSVLSKAQLTKDITCYLEQQNYNSEISGNLAEYIVKSTLCWSPQKIDVKKADYIIGFSFGNRIDKEGNRLPGPMNQQIADLIVKLYKINPIPVYAQWEVQKSIGLRIPSDKITTIYPEISPTGDVIYLSTVGVINNIINDIGKEKVDSKNFIIAAFREHAPRCAMLCQKHGLKNSFVPKTFELPDKYDLESGQPWTRDKFKYMIYDMQCRLEELTVN